MKVHLDSPNPQVELRGNGVSVLEERGDDLVSLGPSIVLCRAPCDTWLDARMGEAVFVTGPDVPQSEPLILYDKKGNLDLEVDPGNGPMRTGGGVLASLGVLALLGSVPTLVVAGVKEDNGDDVDDIWAGGGVAAGAGALMLTGGVFLTVYGSTEVTVTPGVAP